MPRLLLTLTFAASSVVFAQTNTGSITGTVLDPENAVVPGAKITATNKATNVAQKTVSSSAGSYSIPALVPGTYKVLAEASGFKSAVRDSVVVETSRTSQLDMSLSIGQTSETVTISAEAPLVQQANAAVQYSINQKAIDELPLQNQSVLRVLETIPGVVGEAGGEQSAATMGFTFPGTAISIAGGRMGATQYQADGVSNNSSFFGRISLSFSADSIQEVQVQQNSFSAEYGRAGSGVVNMTTKSGTNEFHGTVFSFLQNEKLNAAPYTNTVRDKGKQRLWRGGSDVGGPILLPKIYDGRNRSFFFVGYEPLRHTTSTTWYQRVPTLLEREGDFSQSLYDTNQNYPATIFRQWEFGPDGQLSTRKIVPAPGQPYPIFEGAKIPKHLISPIGRKLVDILPLPNYVNPDPTSRQNYRVPMTVNNVDNRHLIKFDQIITNANRMSIRLARVPTHGNRFYYGGPDSLAEVNGTDVSLGTNVAFNDTHTWGANKVNELRLGYNRSNISRRQNDIQLSKDWYKEFGLPSRLDRGMPDFSIGGGYENPVAGVGEHYIDNTYQLIDIFNWVKGKHTLKIGFEFQAPQQNLVNYNNVQGNWTFAGSGTGLGTGVETTPFAGVTGATTGHPIATLLLGFPTGVAIAPTVIPYQYRWKYYAGFLQDDIKVTPRLTLNIGIRYQVEVPRSEKHHNQGSYVDDFATDSRGQRVRGYIQLSGLGTGPTTLFPTRYNNFEPRLGIAYRLPGQGLKSLKVVRMGYGISHVPTNGLFNSPFPNLNPNSDQLATTGGRDGSFVQIDRNPLILPSNWPEWPADGKFADLSRIGGASTMNQNVVIPYLQQWNFGLGFEFGGNMGFELTYVGSKGTNLFGPSARSNLINFEQYKQLYTSGANLTEPIPNPFGLLNAAGNVVTVTRQNALRPNPLIGSIADPLAQGYNSNYNSLQAQLTKRYSNGIQFNANYTFGKSIDDSSCEGQFCTSNLGNFSTAYSQLLSGNRQLERSVSTYDITHVIRYSFNWDLPFGRGQRFGSGVSGVLNQIVGGWKMNGIGSFQSGKPWLAFLNSTAGFPEDTGNIRPNWKPGVTGGIINPNWRNQLNDPARRYAQYFQVDQMFDVPGRFEIGNVPRTIPYMRMPWTQTLNASILKDFFIREQIRLQFRVEAFSVLNHVNFIGNVNNNTVFQNLNYQTSAKPVINPVTNIRTGYSDMTMNIGPQRQLQLGLKLYF